MQEIFSFFLQASLFMLLTLMIIPKGQVEGVPKKLKFKNPNFVLQAQILNSIQIASPGATGQSAIQFQQSHSQEEAKEDEEIVVSNHDSKSETEIQVIPDDDDDDDEGACGFYSEIVSNDCKFEESLKEQNANKKKEQSIPEMEQSKEEMKQSYRINGQYHEEFNQFMQSIQSQEQSQTQSYTVSSPLKGHDFSQPTSTSIEPPILNFPSKPCSSPKKLEKFQLKCEFSGSSCEPATPPFSEELQSSSKEECEDERIPVIMIDSSDDQVERLSDTDYLIESFDRIEISHETVRQEIVEEDWDFV